MLLMTALVLGTSLAATAQAVPPASGSYERGAVPCTINEIAADVCDVVQEQVMGIAVACTRMGPAAACDFVWMSCEALFDVPCRRPE
jgi:hypothetical protein